MSASDPASQRMRRFAISRRAVFDRTESGGADTSGRCYWIVPMPD